MSNSESAAEQVKDLYDAEIRRQEQERVERERQFAAEADRSRRLVDDLRAHCRPARAEDYAAWLSAWVKDGGPVTHHYDYPLTRGDSWLVLTTRPAGIPELHGSFAVHVIVPEDIGFTPDGLPRAIGHNQFYFVEGSRNVGGWVPLYSDVAKLLD